MQTYIERYYQNQLHSSNIRNVILGWSLGIVLLILLSMASLFFIRLNDSRLILNCASFNSYAEAIKALPLHAGLDWNHDGHPCEKEFPNG